MDLSKEISAFVEKCKEIQKNHQVQSHKSQGIFEAISWTLEEIKLIMDRKNQENQAEAVNQQPLPNSPVPENS